MVVDNVGQMVGRQIVGALVEHFVVEDARVYRDTSAEKIVDCDFAARLNLEPDNVGLPFGDTALNFFGANRQRVAHLSARRGVILEIRRGLAGCLKLFGGVESYIGFPRVEKHSDMFAVDVAALALAVGAVGTSFAHAFVDFYAEPCQRLVDIVFGAGNKPA